MGFSAVHGAQYLVGGVHPTNSMSERAFQVAKVGPEQSGRAERTWDVESEIWFLELAV